MIFSRWLKASLKPVNLIILAFTFTAFYITEYPAVIPAGIALYLLFVVLTLNNSEFRRRCTEEEKIGEIQRLNRECNLLFNRLVRKIDRNMRSRAEKILKEKDELMRFFKSRRDAHVRLKIMEQSLKLVMSYLHLTYNYCLRVKEVSPAKFNAISDRIARNNARLGHLKSYDAVLELTKTIEMDEKLLEMLREEKNELERTSVKLDYIESTISAFKHQIISNDSDDPEVEEIEHVINEAMALDHVLNSRRKNRIDL